MNWLFNLIPTSVTFLSLTLLDTLICWYVHCSTCLEPNYIHWMTNQTIVANYLWVEELFQNISLHIIWQWGVYSRHKGQWCRRMLKMCDCMISPWTRFPKPSWDTTWLIPWERNNYEYSIHYHELKVITQYWSSWLQLSIQLELDSTCLLYCSLQIFV